MEVVWLRGQVAGLVIWLSLVKALTLQPRRFVLDGPKLTSSAALCLANCSASRLASRYCLKKPRPKA